MSKESKAFLKGTHLLINDAVDCAIHVLRGSDFTINDRLGGVLEEKDVDILRNIIFVLRGNRSNKIVVEGSWTIICNWSSWCDRWDTYEQ